MEINCENCGLEFEAIPFERVSVQGRAYINQQSGQNVVHLADTIEDRPYCPYCNAIGALSVEE